MGVLEDLKVFQWCKMSNLTNIGTDNFEQVQIKTKITLTTMVFKSLESFMKAR